MRDLVAAAQAARARKASNGHARDHVAEAKVKAMNLANDLMAEIKSRFPLESRESQLLRFFRAVSHSTDVDLFDMFYGDEGRDVVVVLA
jgi:hypothetical protein